MWILQRIFLIYMRKNAKSKILITIQQALNSYNFYYKTGGRKNVYRGVYSDIFGKTGAAFDEPVAETYEEAEEFLEDCMAVVADSIDEVRKYLSGMGADVDGMSNEELEEASEVFALPDGKYLIVEG